MQIKLNHLQENNYFSELGFCCILIKNFLQKYCENKIKKIKDFPFSKIISDKSYGDIGKKGGKKKTATIENTQIAKAIYFVLFAETLEDLSTTTLFSYKSNKIAPYKSTLIFQGYNIFGDDETLKTLKNIFKDKKYSTFIQKVANFQLKIQTIGNFILFPADKINNNSTIDTSIITYLLKLKTIDDDFYKLNLLEEINELNKKNLDFKDIFLNQQSDNLKDIFVQYAETYIEIAEKLIEIRANKIISLLIEKLK